MIPSRLHEDPCWYRALTLSERRTLLSDTLPSRQRRSRGERRYRRWRDQPPFDDDDAFAERLADDDLDPTGFRALLGASPEELRDLSEKPPAWLVDLATAYGSAAHEAGAAEPVLAGLEVAPRQGRPDLRLTGLFRPLVEPAVGRLVDRLASLAAHDSPPRIPVAPIAGQLSEQLLSRLYEISRRTLALELNVARMRDELAGDTGEERYRDFLHRLRDPARALELLAEYPVLARTAVETVARWTATSLELVDRLHGDWQRVRDAFGLDGSPLAEIESDAGDSHRGGRTVALLRFASGRRVVYKPRPLAVEEHFGELVRWFEGLGFEPSLRTLTVLDRGDYGWVEFAAAAPCSGEDELARFYARQGAYLALLYLLEANDFHYQNLVASGEHPIPVDLESIFQVRLADRHPSAGGRATHFMGHSVTRTGLLPRRSWVRRGYAGLDISGLGGAEDQLLPFQGLRAADAASDTMRIVSEELRLPSSQNRPRLGDRAAAVTDHEEELVDGFRRAYRLLARHRDELCAPDGPLQRFRNDEVRVIMRPTRTYRLLLGDSFHPDFLRDALDRDLHLDKLWASRREWSKLARVVRHEREQLQAGDVPLFTTRPGVRRVETPAGGVLADFCDEPAYDSVARRARELGERDLEFQTWLVHASLAVLRPDAGHGVSAGYRHDASRSGPVSRHRLLALARGIGDRLQELAIRDDDGQAAWIGLADDFELFLAPAVLRSELYDGLGGIAVFLAHLAAASGEPRYDELAEAAWSSAESWIEMGDQTLDFPGAFTGRGGLVLAMLHLGELWQRPDLLDRAEELALGMPELLGSETDAEIVYGAAGGIGALLALHRHRPAAAALDAARRLGEFLVDSAVPGEAGCGWMGRQGDRPLSGFSHGAAGIAWALLGLAEASGHGRYRETAEAAIAYERTLFSEAHGNWRDLRSGSADTDYGYAWCNGAPGIGLARLDRLAFLERGGRRPDVREEIHRALDTTWAQGFGDNQSLCHGDLGNLELLVEAGRRLPDPGWSRRAERMAAVVVERMEADGPRCGLPGGLENPGLMTGLAGIGYALLRLADPERVPSLLLLQAPRRRSARDREPLTAAAPA